MAHIVIEDIIGTDPTPHLRWVRFIAGMGALFTARHFYLFWEWYFSTLIEMVDTHRLLFGRGTPSLTERSHTVQQILFASAYMLLSALLPLTAFLIGLYYSLNIMNEVLGFQGAWVVGVFLGFYVGGFLSDLARTLVDKLFHIGRLERDLRFGIPFLFMGKDKGNVKGGSPVKGVLAFFAVSLAILLFVLVLTAVAAPAAPAPSVQTAGLFDGIGRMIRDGWQSGSGYVEQMPPLSALKEEEYVTRLLSDSLRKRDHWKEGLGEACARDANTEAYQ